MLEIGMKAPEFTLSDKDGNTVYIPHKTIPLCQILSLG